MSTRTPAAAAARKSAKTRSSKARARTPGRTSRSIAARAAIAPQDPLMHWSRDLRDGMAAAELMLSDAGQAVAEAAIVAAQRARGVGRRAADYAREHPVRVAMSALALAFVAARLWSARAAARS
jgi:hypothetical protein